MCTANRRNGIFLSRVLLIGENDHENPVHMMEVLQVELANQSIAIMYTANRPFLEKRSRKSHAIRRIN